ncbi:hypothetical protein GCM10029963_40520 [Micromonospora andamanensis]
MADPESRDTGERESSVKQREQDDRQRVAEEGAEVPGRGQNLGPGDGPRGDELGKRPAASQRGEHSLPQPAGGHSVKTMSDPDVVLQIPQVKVEQLYVEVDNLDASVSLRARLGSLLQLDVGVQAHLGTVKIDIKGVEAQAMLEVRLEELRGILDSALRTIERNPQIVESLVKTVDTAVNQVGQAAQQALGPQGRWRGRCSRPPSRSANNSGRPRSNWLRTGWQRLVAVGVWVACWADLRPGRPGNG